LIGFDRPLRPEWIYETLKILEVGKRPSLYNGPFEDIAKELVGKEGKRKARTIIFRSFIYSLQDTKDIIQNNMFIEWVKEYPLEKMKTLFFFKILMDYEIARFITRKIELCVDNTNHISVALLSKKMVQEHGDRDVVKRSLRSFLSTLVNFGILSQIDKNNYKLLDKTSLCKRQIKNFLLLYAKTFLKSQVVDLEGIESGFLFYFNTFDLVSVANEYNGVYWEYIRDINRNQLIIRRMTA
jgi:hypothetical protein